MSPTAVLAIAREGLELTVLMMLILLIPALVVGVLVAVFQAATQINEQTLSFIPKLLITVLIMLMAGPMLLRMLTEYTVRLYQNIPGLIGN